MVARIRKNPNVAEKVYKLACLGLTQKIIATAVGVPEERLRSMYGEDWKEGKSKGTGQIAKRLFELCMSDNETVALKACQFYLKTQAGWNETSRLEITGADGEPLKLAVDVPPQETREQWLMRKQLELATPTTFIDHNTESEDNGN